MGYSWGWLYCCALGVWGDDAGEVGWVVALTSCGLEGRCRRCRHNEGQCSLAVDHARHCVYCSRDVQHSHTGPAPAGGRNVTVD